MPTEIPTLPKVARSLPSRESRIRKYDDLKTNLPFSDFSHVVPIYTLKKLQTWKNAACLGTFQCDINARKHETKKGCNKSFQFLPVYFGVIAKKRNIFCFS